MGERAVMLENTDHHTICTVGNENDVHFQGFILPAIRTIKDILLGQYNAAPPAAPEGLLVGLCLVADRTSILEPQQCLAGRGVTNFLDILYQLRVLGVAKANPVPHWLMVTAVANVAVVHEKAGGGSPSKSDEAAEAGTEHPSDEVVDGGHNPGNDQPQGLEEAEASGSVDILVPNDTQVKKAWEEKAILCIGMRASSVLIC